MTLPQIEAVMTDVKIPSDSREIKIKQMRAKDQKLLLVAKADAGSDEDKSIAILNSIKQVVQNCIVTPNVDVNVLALFDVEWLFLKLQELSVANIVEAPYRDNEEWQDYATEREAWEAAQAAPAEDGKMKVVRPEPKEPAVYNFKIDLKNVEVRFPEKSNKTIEVPGIKINLHYPPAALYTNKEFLNSTGEKTLDTLMMTCIDTVNDAKFSDESLEERQQFLDNIPARQYGDIQNFLGTLPYLFYEIKYTNKKGNERTITLSKLTDFFQLA